MPVSVLIVDDSSTVRTLLTRILQSDPDITVCGAVADGETALSLAQSKKPDVITLDLNMPGMSGQEVARKIMEVSPIPIVIVTTDQKSTSNPFSLLEAGAVAVLDKPAAPGHPQHKEAATHLIQTIKALKGKRIVPRQVMPTNLGDRLGSRLKVPNCQSMCIAIGASTGGPVILKQIVDSLPADYPIPVIITQHISKGFTGSLVKWLGSSSKLSVVAGSEGTKIQPGWIYLAPDDVHMGITSNFAIQLSDSGREYGMRPAIAYMFRSIERVYADRCTAILLSGMGRDGATEMAALRSQGALTVAQDKESSLIHGMPGEAIACGGAVEILSPNKIVELLLSLPHQEAHRAAKIKTGKSEPK